MTGSCPVRFKPVSRLVRDLGRKWGSLMKEVKGLLAFAETNGGKSCRFGECRAQERPNRSLGSILGENYRRLFERFLLFLRNTLLQGRMVNDSLSEEMRKTKLATEAVGKQDK